MTNYGTTKETIDYKTFLKYIETLRKTGIKARTLQGYIGKLKRYFNYLQEANYRTDNPIINIKIKGIVKTVVGNLLSAEELEDLYYSYSTETKDIPPRRNVREAIGLRKRNKVIIGLLVYQGIQTKELQYLQEQHVELYKGKIHIPGGRKTNGRTLELKPWQLMDFMEYIKEIKPQLEQSARKKSPSLLRSPSFGGVGEARVGEASLFTSAYGNTTLNNVLKQISRELKQINYNYQNTQQIRNSVIVNWLKQHNLRKTQYLAGHRYISSTERYRQDNLEELHEMVNTYHPIQ